MKKFFEILIAVVIAVLWVETTFAQDVVRLGCSISLTGKLTYEGKLVRDGYEFYKSLINKKGGLNIGGKRYQVSIKYYDDESNIQTGTKLVEKLITDDKIDFILGPYGAGPSIATSTISEKYKKLMMMSVFGEIKAYQRGFKYIFGVCPTGETYLKDMFLLASQQQAPKAKTVAFLWKNDYANKELTGWGREDCKEYGLNIVYDEKFPAEASDFSAELTVMKAKNPDILVFLSQLGQFVLGIKQVKDMKINPKMIMNGMVVPQPELVKSLGKDAEYLVGQCYWYPTFSYKDELFGDSRNYTREFKQMFGYEPSYHNAGASSAIEVLGIALEKAGDLNVEKVRTVLSTMKENTFWGPVEFDETGRIKKKNLCVGQIINGKYTLVFPPELAEAKLIWPKPAW